MFKAKVQNRKERLGKILDILKQVLFRETAHSNYKHLETMLLLPVATNSKLFSLCHGNCGFKQNPKIKISWKGYLYLLKSAVKLQTGRCNDRKHWSTRNYRVAK